MARIRTIKPELPHSETLGAVSRDARLLFVNLFTIADDDGRARASSRLLASLLYPFDDDAPALMDGWLEELAEIGAIRLYEVDGTAYLDIPKWLEHQKIDRPSKSRIPPHSVNTREASRGLDALSSTLDLVPSPLSPPNGGGYSQGFAAFWILYPSKAGKDQAHRAWKKAERQGRLPSQEALVEAIGRCIQSKPADIEYKSPANWISGGCWHDEYSQTSEGPTGDPNENLWKARIANWKPGKYWNHGMWGPSPDQTGCKVPKSLLGSRPPEMRKSA